MSAKGDKTTAADKARAAQEKTSARLARAVFETERANAVIGNAAARGFLADLMIDLGYFGRHGARSEFEQGVAEAAMMILERFGADRRVILIKEAASRLCQRITEKAREMEK